MNLSMHDMAVGSFLPMLESMSEVLAKGAEHAKSTQLNLVNARLAPDMFTLAQQVQQACHYAKDATSRLTGKGDRQGGLLESGRRLRSSEEELTSDFAAQMRPCLSCDR